LAILVLAFFAGRYCMHCCYAKPKPKPKGKDGKDGKTLTHTPSKKALRDPNAARAEAYAKVLRDPKTSRRKEAAKNDVEYAAETAAVQVAVRAAVSNPPHREHEARERRAKKEATASELLSAPALAPLPEPVLLPEPMSLPEARPEQSLPTFRAVTALNDFLSQVISARFSPHAPATEPANDEVVAPAAVPEKGVTDDPSDLNA
jgi:hypothetical protein